MNTGEFKFRFLGQYDQINNIRQLVHSLTYSDWTSFKKRQTIASKNGFTIPLLYPEKDIRKAVPHQKYEMFREHISNLEKLLQCSTQRAILVNLPAGNHIDRHKDVGEFLSKTKRVHLPIITNEECLFVIEGDSMVLQEGELWEVNNTGMYHSVHNYGKIDRVHLIVDIA